MTPNTPNRWDDSTVKRKPKGAFETAASLGGRFLALPPGVRLAILAAVVIVLAGLTGTVLYWAAALLALIGKLILLAIVAFILIGIFRKKK
jgi:hypothetical protein